MITDTQYKLLAGQFADYFCKDDVNKTLCKATIKERIVSSFDNTTFRFFLENISRGRFFKLQLANWKVVSGCRNMGITARFTDVITNAYKAYSWTYTNSDCQAKQFYYPDLNHQIKQAHGLIILDTPITSKENSDVGKPRLVYSSNAVPAYGLEYVGTTLTPPSPIMPPGLQPPPKGSQAGGNGNGNGNGEGGFDIQSLLSNPMVLLGIGAVAFFFLMKD